MSLSLQRGNRREGGRRETNRDTQPPGVSGLAGLQGATRAHVRPGECRREAGAAVARGRVRLCWKLLQCGQLRVGTGVRVGGAAESRRPVSLSVPGPTLRDCRPAFGCCALSLQLFPSGSFLGGPWGGLRLRSGLEDPPRGRGAGPGLMRRGGALFAG